MLKETSVSLSEAGFYAAYLGFLTAQFFLSESDAPLLCIIPHRTLPEGLNK